MDTQTCLGCVPALPVWVHRSVRYGGNVQGKCRRTQPHQASAAKVETKPPPSSKVTWLFPKCLKTACSVITCTSAVSLTVVPAESLNSNKPETNLSHLLSAGLHARGHSVHVGSNSCCSGRGASHYPETPTPAKIS